MKQTRFGPALASALVVALAACGPGASETEGSGASMSSSAPDLKGIMQDLEADMAEAAHGVWVDSAAVVAAGAQAVADHPRVPPEEMAAIQEVLGDEFPAFAQMDRAVHDGSVALAEAARDGASMAELLGLHQEIQEGCVACHETFRDRVTPALAALREG